MQARFQTFHDENGFYTSHGENLTLGIQCANRKQTERCCYAQYADETTSMYSAIVPAVADGPRATISVILSTATQLYVNLHLRRLATGE